MNNKAFTRGTGWFKSSFSNAQNGCVEVNVDGARERDEIGIRDSKLGAASPVLVTGNAGWRAFLHLVL